MKKILVIQTAFIGDVVLATALIEKLIQYFPDAKIDMLVRKGNESLLQNSPHLNSVLIWNKKEGKVANLLKMLKKIKSTKYDKVINLQRFFATGFLTAFSGADEKIGFDKNPLSFLYTSKIPHIIGGENPKHETERNNNLIAPFTDNIPARPKLYPSKNDFDFVAGYSKTNFITVTPSSVWFTKQYPITKWIEFINEIPSELKIYLLGGKDNFSDCNEIKEKSENKNVEILAGKLSFLQSAALMSKAKMNFVNDSAPLHFASAMNAPVTAVFCSTIPAFGYTPLSDKSFIIETKENLACRPCGLHGKKACPLGHFKCAYTIETQQLLNTIYAN